MEIITPPKMTSQTTILSECKLCGGSGWVIEKQGDKEIARPCKCYKQRIRNSKIKFANIPETYKSIRLDDFKTDKYGNEQLNNMVKTINKTIVNYIKNLDEYKELGVGLYLYSKTKGSGKTLLATAVANEMIYTLDMNVKFVTSLDIINEIKATWDKNNNQEHELETEYKLMNYLKTTEVLVIDDFGTEKYRDWYDDKFYEIINTRYSNRLITIYTSNCSIDQLSYEEQIKSRMRERTFGIHMPEKSVRDLIAKERQEELRRLSDE